MSNPPSLHDSQTRHVPPETKVVGPQDDMEIAGNSFSQSDRPALQVIDAPFDGTTPQVRAVLSPSNDIAEGMRCLPPHSSGTARIFDITIHSDFIITGLRDTKGPERTRLVRDVLTNFLQETYGYPFEERQIFRSLNDPLYGNDLGSLSSQWSQRLGVADSRLYRLVNRTSLQQDPLDYDLHPRESYMTCAQDVDDRLIVVIVNNIQAEQEFNLSSIGNDYILFRNPRCISNLLAGTSLTYFSDGSLDTFVKLLTLDFFLTSIYLQPSDCYGSLLYPHLPEKQVMKFPLAKNPHLQAPLAFEAQLSTKASWAFREIEGTDGILRNVNNLVFSIRFVIASLKPNYTGDTRQSTQADFERAIRAVEELYSERQGNVEKALEALTRQLDYLTRRAAIREAGATRMLTVLATLYLPLSLSAALLSMSSPFKQVAHDKPNDDQDLTGTNLLFDFFGLFIVLATATITVPYVFRLGIWLKSNGPGLFSKDVNGSFSLFSYGKRWRFGGRGGRIFEMLYLLTTWWISVGLGVTLLVIFCVAMLRTARDSWETAKWMLITYLAISGALLACTIGIYQFMRRKRFRGD